MILDLAIRGGTVVTASDVGLCDVGVKDGRLAEIQTDPLQLAAKAVGSKVLTRTYVHYMFSLRIFDN